MSYSLIVKPAAARQFKKLESQIRQRIGAALHGLQSEPRPVGSRKLAGGQGDWRIRIGDHRVLYEIDEDSKLVTVWRIAHRRNAYR